MSMADVEVVRAIIAEFLAGGYEASLGHYAEDVEGDFTHMPDGRVAHGREGIREEVARWQLTWDSFETELEEAVDAGDLVMIVVRQSGVGKGSGMKTSIRYAQLFRLRGDEVVWMKTYLDVDEGRHAAGLG